MNQHDRHPTDDRPAWIEQARAVLDDSARDLDATTLSRLNRARQTALAQRRPRAAHPWLLPAGLASACALLLAVAVWQPRRHIETEGPAILPAGATATAAEAEGTADETSPEFYQNLEFYAWLEAQNQGSGG